MHVLIRVVSVFLTLALVVACGPAEEASQATEDRPVVALIMKSLANEFFVTMAMGARNHHEANAADYELIVNGIRNETDLAQQVQLVDQMIASGVDAIVMVESGIVAVNIDNRFDDAVLGEYGLDIPFVGPDNFEGARMVGEYLAGQLAPGQQVAVLEGVPTTINSQQRTAGFLKAMTDAGIDVVAQQSAQWDQTIAITVASGILVQHPDLSAILAANDNMALGAVAAITQAGKSGDIAVVGFDNISAMEALLKDGAVLATADQHADLLAVYGIEYALQALATGAELVDRGTPVDLVTVDDLD
jgi:ribose transport system substrate-binding protein